MGSVSEKGTIALAATLNWIMKDGIGQIGGIVFVAMVGSRFDGEAKRFRFLSAVCLSFATLMEIFIPLFPNLFLPIASVANACKIIFHHYLK